MRNLILLVVVIAAGCAGAGEQDGWGVDEQESARSCALVRCFAAPICGDGQHVIYTPSDCCGRCVGPNTWAPHCANVLCAAVQCPAGEERVYSPGKCCGTCVPIPPETCGDNTCAADEYCCNESCSTCAPFEGVCTQEICTSL